MCARCVRFEPPKRGRREGAQRPPDDRPKRGGLRSGARASAPADLAPRMREGMRVEERAHRGGSAHPSGAEQEQRGGITPPAGQRAKRAEGRGDGGEGTGDTASERGQWPRRIACGRSAPNKRQRRGNIRARTRREPSKGERRAQRAEASAASRSERDPTKCPLSVARGAGARRHAAAATAHHGLEESGSAAQPPEERDA